MSHLFGPCVQQGYVVPEIYAAISHWLARGIGPFYIEEHISPPAEFDGRAFTPDISAAFTYCGDQQIEVVQQHDNQDTVYKEFLQTHPEGGLHHLAFWVDDIAAVIEKLPASGKHYCLRQVYGGMHAYLDCVEQPGVMIQLMQTGPMMRELFSIIKEGAQSWDGKTEPLRIIDWSTGKAVVRSQRKGTN